MSIDRKRGYKNMLYSISKLNTSIISLFKDNKQTEHITQRSERIKVYQCMGLLDDSNIISCYKVDKKHENGHELHAINKKGLIYIYNFKSRKLITILHARANQIKRYYEATNESINAIKNILQLVEKRNKKHDLNNK
jgi:hypothetical protein